ncbi:MAG TPA: hypothetical protein VMH87_05040 [Pseudomonadales bacterium]|nr:hypothetical protein [Pseudomonadales bacterium]
MKFDYQDYVKNGAWKNYSIRPDPELSMAEKRRFIVFAYLGAMLLAFIIGYWSHEFLTSFIMAHVVAICLYAKAFPVRCPECEGKVITRIVDDEELPDECYHYCHDCPQCQISWETKTYRRSSS